MVYPLIDGRKGVGRAFFGLIGESEWLGPPFFVYPGWAGKTADFDTLSMCINIQT